MDFRKSQAKYSEKAYDRVGLSVDLELSQEISVKLLKDLLGARRYFTRAYIQKFLSAI